LSDPKLLNDIIHMGYDLIKSVFLFVFS